MDNVDKQLISMLHDNGRASLSEIGKKLRMSHVAVSKRLDKLIQQGLAKVTVGVNAEALDMKLLFMAIETDNLDIAEHIINKYQNCPRVLMIAPVTGRYNLFAVMVAEDSWTLESIIGTCSLRTEKGVRRSETWFGNAPKVPEYVMVDLAPLDDGKVKAPCGITCESCKRYGVDKCVGCPATSSYRGLLWSSELTERKRGRKSKS
ncbi:MAG: Lrp/AsnC family transcriptional regulator [Candidatus Thorarchaeota archaeon]|nr:MAG: Lrp/AsnC family transcriptional regulator [Candidatus Thorarchaeota archaeon]